VSEKSISVIIPAYKAGWCIENCLDSVEKQSMKPGKVLIGCDACEESFCKVQEIRDNYDLDIHLYMFPVRSGPYRIRNTLVLLSDSAIVSTFDADDIMYGNHLETMYKTLEDNVYVSPTAWKQEGNSTELRPWPNCHGIVMMYKKDFIKTGGYEPWICGADTESLTRWNNDGLTKKTLKYPTLLIHKHSGGLTRNKETGLHSDIRNKYSEEIKRRKKSPVSLDKISVGYFIEEGSTEDLYTDMPEQVIEGGGDRITVDRAAEILEELSKEIGRTANKNPKLRSAKSRAGRWLKKYKSGEV